MRRAALATTLFAGLLGLPTLALAQDAGSVTVHVQPVHRAQMAIWLESAPDATGSVSYFRTILLTQAVSLHGIGNRPGALGLNSGYRYPYGRREGVLPVWAHRRVELAHQSPFPRVIFRNRDEGAASQRGIRSPDPYSDNPDPYFCLSFTLDARPESHTPAALDAVSCPSVYNSDRGRYIHAEDVASGYAEPVMQTDGTASAYALGMTSLYPARRDVACPPLPATCPNDPSTRHYAPDALAALPEIDSVSQATMPEHDAPPVRFALPPGLPPGRYTLYVEVNTEGDYNATYDPTTLPPPNASTSPLWDGWAQSDGYAYRGQPSVVYRLDFALPTVDPMMDVVLATLPVGHGSTDGRGAHDAAMYAVSDGTMTMDVPGSGAQRLQTLGADGSRVRLEVRSPMYCRGSTPPSDITDLVAGPVLDVHYSHEFANLAFTVPRTDRPIMEYAVRVATSPIVDQATFDAATPANAATIDTVGLVVPTDGAAGTQVDVQLGGLAPLTHYWVGVQTETDCASGHVAVADFWTTAIHFTTVSPCFVATAAYGTPMAADIGVLRRFRDRQLRTNAAGRALVAAYYRWGPALAARIAPDDSLRAAVRTALEPVVALARSLGD